MQIEKALINNRLREEVYKILYINKILIHMLLMYCLEDQAVLELLVAQLIVILCLPFQI